MRSAKTHVGKALLSKRLGKTVGEGGEDNVALFNYRIGVFKRHIRQLFEIGVDLGKRLALV